MVSRCLLVAAACLLVAIRAGGEPGAPPPPEGLPPAKTVPAGQPADTPPTRLSDALGQSLVNVQVVQAHVAVRTAGVARFEALRSFVPLSNLPVLEVAFRRLSGNSTDGTNVIWPDITGGTPLVGRPGLDHADLNRMNLFFPIDPSGFITTLPIAEEGVRAKELMEHLIRRSQAVVAAQRYFEAKQVPYGLRAGALALEFSRQSLGRAERRLAQKQIEDIEVSQAQVNMQKAAVLLSDLEKTASITQRRLGVVLHRSRLLSPQDVPQAIEPQWAFAFDLADPDSIDLRLIPDLPQCREDAIRLAKRQRYEVRLQEVGLRIARLNERGSKWRLFGKGQLPLGISFKNTSIGNGGVAFGAIFGTTYDMPLLDVGLWSNLKRAHLDVVLSQLELEKALLEVAEDAGSAWDRCFQAFKEWELKEAELRLRQEYLDRARRLLAQQQAIELDVLAAEVARSQTDAARWTAWFNLQLARLDLLRATEMLLDYIEKAGIAPLPTTQAVMGKHP